MNKSVKVAGFEKQSFVDYPGKIAFVIFLGGCNFVCHYCHNNHILGASSNNIDFEDVLWEIKERLDFIDAVVISGGEPTVHPDLEHIIAKVRELGVLVKLDTNGTNFEILKRLVCGGMVDYVAMDVKAPIEKYEAVVGVPAGDDVVRSIEFLKQQDAVDYMFRLTLSPMLDGDDIKKIALLVDGARCVQLQQFVPNAFSSSHRTVLLPYSKSDAEKFGLYLAKRCKKLLMRGF